MPAHRASDAGEFGNKLPSSSFKKKERKKGTKGEMEAPACGNIWLAVRLWLGWDRGDLIPSLVEAAFLWGQGTRNGQGVSVMERSVPISTVIHSSWAQSELRWLEGTIRKYLQAKGYLRSVEVDVWQACGSGRSPLAPVSRCQCLGGNWTKY